eukprot:11208644-Lingulodinium_polyedra.AAC.1
MAPAMIKDATAGARVLTRAVSPANQPDPKPTNKPARCRPRNRLLPKRRWPNLTKDCALARVN